MPITGTRQLKVANAIRFQALALQKVSRTFALTIPVLPTPIRHVISNAYLLCRIADTIEDEPTFDSAIKRSYLDEFSKVVTRRTGIQEFTASLSKSLTGATPNGERELVANTPLVVGFHLHLPHVQRESIDRCIKAMCTGMGEFVDTGIDGLKSLAEVDRYCHFVAGVVGEMITEIFCDYSDEIAARREELYALASCFGRGLQLVNILKDRHADIQRGVRWLPRESRTVETDKELNAGAHMRAHYPLNEVIGVARDYLDAALHYMLLIPPKEAGIRRFLAWTLGFASLTLRKVHANPEFKQEEEVKISRSQVYGTIVATNLAIRSNRALSWLFEMASPPHRQT